MTAHVQVADLTMPHRLGSATITVVGPDGAALANTPVEVRQVRHDFLFGNILFDLIPLMLGESDDQVRDEAELAEWRELFNFGTLPFYWRYFEPTEGAPQTAALLAAARRFADMGIKLKGHPLTWHTLAPHWLMGRPLDQVEKVLRARITRDVSDFAGVIDVWDAINEVVIMPEFKAEDNAITPLCASLGRVDMAKLAFETARQANPNATLLLNDFDLSVDYEHLIETLLEAGLKIDVLGLQTHMHQGYRGDDATTELLDRFARFGLPLHLTETSLVSGQLMPPDIIDLNDYQVEEWPSTPEGEARQAEQIATYYRTLMAHPAVQAVTYWGLTDRAAWLHAPIGFLRADGSRKPSYDALHDLVKGQWWLPPTTVLTDEAGRIDVTAFKGDYEYTVVPGAPEAVNYFHLG